MLSLILTAALGAAPMTETYTWTQAETAIRTVETGASPNEGRGAVGDGGRALGSYQIHHCYWIDAVLREPDLKTGGYRRVLNDKEHSELIVRAYMRRYQRASFDRLVAGKGKIEDIERIARCHNGGPQGARRDSTLVYWAKIRKVLR